MGAMANGSVHLKMKQMAFILGMEWNGMGLIETTSQANAHICKIRLRDLIVLSCIDAL